MDAKFVDQIAIRIASGTRRGLLRHVTGLALGGGVLALLGEETEARRHGKHHKKKKKKKHNNPGCVCGVNQSCVDGECVTCDVCARECPFASVQQAVDAASPGSTIRICGGFFRPVTITKDVTLIGVGSQLGGTALKGDGVARVVIVAAGVTAAFLDLMIDDGFSSDEGGGCLNQGTLKLTNCVVRDSQAQRGGGIFNASAAALTLLNSTVTSNAANTTGGGIFNDVGGSVNLASGSSVTGNTPNNCAGDPVAGCS